MHVVSKQLGASLLEVMVALLVMSLGLLGMAALQASTAKYRINTQANTAVAQLVSELTERVRVNPDAAGPSFDSGVGGGASLYVLDSKWATQTSEKLTVNKDCEKNICTSAERAEFDMTQWRQRVRESLPQGGAIVQGDRKSGMDVTLMWMDKEQTLDEEVDGALNRSLRLAPVCTADASGAIVHNCCPDVAAAPAGVRCLRMSFLP